MTTKTFYVKIRGRVLGPFPPKRLMQMASQGQLSRVHQLSTDGNDWHRADKYPELFNKASAGTASTQPASQQTSQQQASPVASQPAATADWHYGIDGDSDGPVAKSKIISMIKKQALDGSDLLWHNEMDEWQSIDSLPEFAAYLPTPVSIDVGGSGNVRARNEGRGSTTDLGETSRILRAQSPWVLFIYICMYVFSGLLFLGFLFGVIKGGQAGDNQMIAQGISALLQMVVVTIAAIFLSRFSSHVNRFARSKNTSDLNQALAWLQRFWLLVSIVLIIFIFVIVTFLIVVVSYT